MTIKNYKINIYKMLLYLDKDVRTIETDDIRNFLSYYQSYNNCNHNVESTKFVEFMLNMIGKVLDEAILTSSVPITETGININKLLSIMEYNVPMIANEIMDKLGIKSKETLRSTYLDPAIKEGVVSLTIPGSKNPDHIKENISIFDFELSDEDMKEIYNINEKRRYENW